MDDATTTLVHALQQSITQQPHDTRSIAALLDQLAVALRDRHQRESIGATQVPELLTQLMVTAPPGSAHLQPWSDLLMQVGRVAANLAADCDANRERLVQASFIEAVISFMLSSSQISSPMALKTVRAIAASLLNLVVDHHEASVKQLANISSISALVSMANHTYSQARREHTLEDDLATVKWLWTIADIASDQHHDLTLNDDLISALAFPSSSWSWRGIPELENGEHNQPDAAEIELDIVAASSHILERSTLAASESPSTPLNESSYSPSPTALGPVLAFVEDAVLPPTLRDSSPQDQFIDSEGGDDDPPASENPEAQLGQIKAALAKSIVILLSDCSPDDVLQWEGPISRWLAKTEREDLVASAILCYGNWCRSDDAAKDILSRGNFLLGILGWLKPDVPVLVQHAVIGLLRNLSIPIVNKSILGEAGVIERLGDMRVWSEHRDVVSSVQGGAIGLVKNLCFQNLSNVKRFLANNQAVDDLRDLIKRTDDAKLKFEATRILVNCIRSLASVQEFKDPDVLEKISSDWVIETLVDTLRRGKQYLVLVNESVIALTLLTSLTQDKITTIQSALQLQVDDASGDEVLLDLCSKNVVDGDKDRICDNIQVLLSQIKIE